MNIEEKDVIDQLKIDLFPHLKGKISVVGVGNTFRGDDGAGPELIKRLKGKVQIDLFNCAEAPENYLEKILSSQADTIIIVDTAQIGQPDGTVRIFNPDEIKQFGLTTHSLSLKLFIDYIREKKECRFLILAIQPKTLSMGTALSEEVKKTLDALEKGLSEELSQRS